MLARAAANQLAEKSISNLIGPALLHIRAAEREGVAPRTIPAARRLSMRLTARAARRMRGEGGVRKTDGTEKSRLEIQSKITLIQIDRQLSLNRPTLCAPWRSPVTGHYSPL